MYTGGDGTALEIIRRDNRNMDGYRSTSWYPVYEYELEGQVVQKESNVGMHKSLFHKDQQVQILVNPKNIHEYYCPEDRRSLVVGLFVGIGAVILLVGIIATVLVKMSV